MVWSRDHLGGHMVWSCDHLGGHMVCHVII